MGLLANFSQSIAFQPIVIASGLGTFAIVPAVYIDASPFNCFAFLCYLGASDRTTSTLQLMQATKSDGTGSKVVAGALTPNIAANHLAIVESRASALDINNGFRYVALQLTFGGGTSDLGAVIFLGGPARSLADLQPATVAPIVSV